VLHGVRRTRCRRAGADGCLGLDLFLVSTQTSDLAYPAGTVYPWQANGQSATRQFSSTLLRIETRSIANCTSRWSLWGTS
jgi:hypothetical protein